MSCVPNPNRTALWSGNLPDGPLSPRQREIVDAVKGCRALADFVSIPRRTKTTVHIATVEYTHEEQLARQTIQLGIDHARQELDRMERILEAYGSGPFRPQPSAFPGRWLGGMTRHDIFAALVRLLNCRNDVLVRAGDRDVLLHPVDGGYVLAPEDATI